jgi:hypothetical protein
MADREDSGDALEELRTIRARCRELPVLDDRPPDQILGCDDSGVPR